MTTAATRHAKLQSHCHRQQTDTQLFTGQMLFLSPNEQCQSTAGKTIDGWAKAERILCSICCICTGYKRNMKEKFSCKLNPALALLTDWIISSGNTALSVDLLISCLEQLNRDDVVEVLQKGRGNYARLLNAVVLPLRFDFDSTSKRFRFVLWFDSRLTAVRLLINGR